MDWKLLIAYLLFLGSVISKPAPLQSEKITRLPRDVIPTNYEITIIPDLTKKVFNGNVKIFVENKKDVDKIVLHSDVQISVLKIDDIETKNYVQKPQNILEILEEKKSGTHVIEIEYSREFRDDMMGFYLSTYPRDGKEVLIATTQFQSTGARSAFPCFDEPNFKAKFQLTVDKTKIGEQYSHYKTLSNTKLNTTTVNPYIDVFMATPKMSTYLVAFIISDFEKSTEDKFRAWGKKEGVEQLAHVTKEGSKVLNALSQYTDIDYYGYMDKIDNIAIPDFQAGAMENWGAATYREAVLFFDENKSNTASRQQTVTVMAHELAHMWFGDLVTLDWWDYTWLNEGFATYFEYFGAHMVENDWHLDDQFVIDHVQRAMMADSSPSTPAMNKAVQVPSDVSAKFDDISYSKAGSVIRMLSHVVGEEIFKESLRQYLKAMRFKNSVPDNLWNYFNEEGKKIKSWASNTGFPFVTVQLSEQGLALKQERFQIDTSAAKEDTIWDIPLTYAVSGDQFSNTKVQEWFTTNTKDIKLEKNDGWIVFNKKAIGFYRVNYDEELWKRLANALKKANFDGIPNLNRAQMVDDIFNLARIGKVTYATTFDTVQFLNHDTDYLPWVSTFRAFSYLMKRFSPDDEAGKSIRNYMQELLGTFKDLTMSTAEKETDHIKKKRNEQVFSKLCSLENEICVKDAGEKFKEWQGTGKISPDLRSAVFCTAVRLGGPETFDEIWKTYLSSTLASEQVALLNILGCSKDKTTIEKYLMKTLQDDSNIRKQDTGTVFNAVLQNSPIGKRAAFEFLKNNFADIKKYYIGGVNALNGIIMSLADSLTSESEKNELNEFFNKNESELEGVEKDAALKTVTSNMAWSDKYKEDIIKYFKNRKQSKDSSVIARVNIVLVTVMAWLAYTYSVV